MRVAALLLVGLGVAGAEVQPRLPYSNGTVTLSASHLDFYIPYNPGTSGVQMLTVNSATGLPAGFVVSRPKTGSFLVSVSGSATPATITVTAYPPSYYTPPVVADSITLTASGGPAITIPLTLEFWPSPPGTPGLMTSQSSIAWTMASGGTLPAASVTVALGGAPGTVYYGLPYWYAIVASDGNWLRVNGGYSDNGSLPLGIGNAFSLSLSCASVSLPPGIYTGTLHVLAVPPFSYSTYPAPWVVVTVTLTIPYVTPPAAPNLRSSQTSLTFDYQAGSAAPGAQTVSVTTDTGAALGFTAGAASQPVGWLSVQTSSASTPANATVAVNPSGLAPGPYNGTVTFTPAAGSALAVPVTLNVHAAPTVSASPAALAFQWTSGGAKPGSQTIQVMGTTAGLTFGAAPSDGATWLSVTPASGTAPATLTVAVDPSALNPGPYSSSVVVSGTGSATGRTAIPVSLQVVPPLPTITRIGNAASYAGGSVAPGEMLTLFGTGLGPKVVTDVSPSSDGSLPTTLGGVQVQVGGVAAPLVYVSDTQIAAMAPYALAGKSAALAQVTYAGQTSNGVTLPVALTVPGIFTADASGAGPGAIANADFSLNSPQKPAERGATVVLYVTGEGQTIPGGIDGKITTASPAPPYVPQPALPVTVTIDGQPAEVSFYGEAPGIVAGVMQVNVVVPSGVRSGAVPVVVRVGDTASQTTTDGAGAVTVAIR
jgi:uncharacterized protein (TIGR03437 family)